MHDAHRIVDADQAAEPAGVLVAQAVILDLGDQRDAAVERGDAAFGGVEVEAADGGAQHELDQRDAPGDEVEHGGVAGLLPQLARVEAGRLDRDERLGHELLVVAEGPLGRLHAGGVAVEGEDDLAGERVGIHQQPADHRDVLGAERGAAGRDRGRHAGQVAGHHVGVALDDHGAVLAGDLLLGQVDAVEQLALLVDRRLGGVEVLRLDLVVVEEPPGPEADDVAAGVADRPQQPPVEAVDQRRPAATRGPGRRGEFVRPVNPRPAGAW